MFAQGGLTLPRDALFGWAAARPGKAFEFAERAGGEQEPPLVNSPPRTTREIGPTHKVWSKVWHGPDVVLAQLGIEQVEMIGRRTATL